MGWHAIEPIPTPPAASRDAEAIALMAQPFKPAQASLIERFERRYFIHLLERRSGRIGQAARAADMAERNLYDKLRRYGISCEDFK